MRISITVMDKGGDTPHVFNTANDAAKAEAQALFTRLQSQGYSAYRQEESGKAGGLMKDFDPQSSVLMAPNVYLG